MVESRIPTDLKQSFDCNVCFEEYSEERLPCTLPCGHTFCFACVLQLLKGNASVMCPMDKKDLRLKAISGNLSYMNLILKIKSHFEHSQFVPINCSYTKFTKPCRHFMQNETCRFGSKCKFLHIKKNAGSDSSDLYSDYYSDYANSMTSYEDSDDFGYEDDYNDFLFDHLGNENSDDSYSSNEDRWPYD